MEDHSRKRTPCHLLATARSGWRLSHGPAQVDEYHCLGPTATYRQRMRRRLPSRAPVRPGVGGAVAAIPESRLSQEKRQSSAIGTAGRSRSATAHRDLWPGTVKVSAREEP